MSFLVVVNGSNVKDEDVLKEKKCKVLSVQVTHSL